MALIGMGACPDWLYHWVGRECPIVLAHQRESTKHGAYQFCHQQIGMKFQKWHLSGLLSLEKAYRFLSLQLPLYKIGKWVSLTYSLENFQSVAFAQDLSVSGFSCNPFKSWISIPCNSIILLVLIPIHF